MSLGPFSWGRVSGTTFTFKCVCLHDSLGHNYRRRHQPCLRIRNSQRTGHGSSYKHKHTTMPLITSYSNVSHSIPYWEFSFSGQWLSRIYRSRNAGTPTKTSQLDLTNASICQALHDSSSAPLFTCGSKYPPPTQQNHPPLNKSRGGGMSHSP